MIFTRSLMIGGVNKVMMEYANKLVEHGYDVCYVYMSSTDSSVSFETEKAKHICFLCLNSSRMRSSVFKLSNYVKRLEPDIIITENNRVLVAVLVKCINPFKKLKLFTFQHNLVKDEETRNYRLSYAIIYLCSFFCDKIIAVSNSVRNVLIDRLKIPEKKVVTIYNPIDRETIVDNSRKFKVDIDDLILFVGRLSPVKNIPLLIAAFKIFCEQHKETKLIIIGDGEERDKLEALTSELQLTKSVLFLGALTNPYPYINKASVIAITSFSESLSMVCLESLALGKTVASTPNPGCKELLERDNATLGYLSSDFTCPEEFAETLLKAYSKPLDPNILICSTFSFSPDNKVCELVALWENQKK